MQMKVGILSIYDNENMGNKLQNYALQQTLQHYADRVVTIKNKMSMPSLMDRIKRQSPLAESVAVNRLMGKRRKAKLLMFDRRYIRTTRRAYWYNKGDQSLKPKDRCDLYCAGSDQVWNPDLQRQGMFNFLGFAEEPRTFSYAASFGVDKIPAEHEPAVRQGLRHLKHISVREDAGKQIVEELTGRTDARVLADPTMLLTAQEWQGVMSAPETAVPERYLLTYFLGDVSDGCADAIRQRAEALGCQVIALMDPASPFHEIGPGEFLHLIQNARLVCTDSFHASVFSFLFGTPLAVFERKGENENMGSRLATLCAKFSLEDRMVKGNFLSAVPDEADYSAGYDALQIERRKAADYLSMVFQQAKEVGLCD